MEEAIIKYRWELKSKDEEMRKSKDPFETAVDVLKSEVFTEDEARKIEEEERLLDAESRLVYHPEENRFDFGKKRATDLKGNARNISKGVNQL